MERIEESRERIDKMVKEYRSMPNRNKEKTFLGAIIEQAMKAHNKKIKFAEV
jgi:hypothetical protein